MLKNVYNWIDERLDITPMWRDVADHEVPEHVNPAHHFSPKTVTLFLNL